MGYFTKLLYVSSNMIFQMDVLKLVINENLSDPLFLNGIFSVFCIKVQDFFKVDISVIP
jgi:hypothetical protein